MTIPMIGPTRNPIQQTNGKEHHVKKKDIIHHYSIYSLTGHHLIEILLLLNEVSKPYSVAKFRQLSMQCVRGSKTQKDFDSFLRRMSQKTPINEVNSMRISTGQGKLVLSRCRRLILET